MIKLILMLHTLQIEVELCLIFKVSLEEVAVLFIDGTQWNEWYIYL